MFGRILKYDFRSMFKQFGLIWPAALALSLVNRFTISGLGSTSQVGETTAGIAMFVYVSILIAMFVVTVIFIIQRFYKGLLGDEGYLMHTLPVQPWQLIGSKLLTAVVTTLLSIVVAIISIIIVATNGWMPDFTDFFRFLGLLVENWNIDATQSVLFLVELLLVICTGMAQSYLHLYLAMAIGHLFSKNRGIMSVVAYIGINVVLSTFVSILGTVGFLSGLENWLNTWLDFAFNPSWGTIHLMMWIGIAGVAVAGGAFFFGTEYILRKKLNLE